MEDCYDPKECRLCILRFNSHDLARLVTSDRKFAIFICFSIIIGDIVASSSSMKHINRVSTRLPFTYRINRLSFYAVVHDSTWFQLPEISSVSTLRTVEHPVM